MTTWLFRPTDFEAEAHRSRCSRPHVPAIARRRTGECVECHAKTVPPSIRIEAPTWFLARAHAMSVFHTTALEHRETIPYPDVRISWEGHAAGNPSTLRLAVEEVNAPAARRSA